MEQRRDHLETSPPPHRVKRRRSHYARQHRVHYYLVLAGVSAAAIEVLLNLAAFLSGDLLLSDIAFAGVCITSLIIFVAFFLGINMIMNGHIPSHRIKILIPHATVGMLAPLFYTLNIAVDLPTVGSAPISGLALAVNCCCLALLAVQFTMGKRVVRTEPLRLIQ
ncbi:MAG: hypothetical protein ACRDFS_11045 [Chloroflexota bacterium]